MAERHSPLKPEHLSNINAALAKLASAKDICQRAGKCGVDMSAWHAVADHHEKTLIAIRDEFFPRRKV